ncbi:MAG: hypothetical protein DMG30_09585, partial [Acidobacteria bacterium]
YSEKARSLRSISSLRMTQSLADSISHKMTSFLWKTSGFLGNPVESRNDSTSDPALLPAAATEFRTATNGAALFFVAAEALTGSLLPRSLICSLLPGYCAGRGKYKALILMVPCIGTIMTQSHSHSAAVNSYMIVITGRCIGPRLQRQFNRSSHVSHRNQLLHACLRSIK